ncbi:uncharacterized protein LOC124630277 isoform X2 [Helicoverpa zea]|uniref:uncharacterized protein LOC124630277 isoform X2 n=1 Tax=Helicoverpa zea TaxID=7113 RepID=UPI001F5622A5|nr:uncharacterized protein LOC124630277 isoform X2 [Helicoverpa zea]
MEGIYDDLSNYEDVNAVHELRNENKELKVKLEEHAAAMQKLQRDYDTLEMEFKKLENNYSSLLKTARSEIERKNQRITQLNLEKDTMVLEALKKGQTIRRHFNKGVPNNQRYNEKPNFPDNRKETNNKECDVKQKITRTERFEPTPRDTKDLITDTHNRNKFESAGARDVCTGRNTNVVHKKTEFNEIPKMQASSIRDRRKSTPAACSMPVDYFSSDEENKQNYQAKDTRPDYPPLDKFDKRYINKHSLDRHSNKTSETSSFEDRGNNYHEYSSRDSRDRVRSGRNMASSSYRARDKYELKPRKQYSPDRGMKRSYREHQDDYRRQERGRYQARSLESPPPEPYSRHSRRYPEPRPSSDSRHGHDYDKYMYRHEDKYSSKSKLSMDHDEPQSKRLRRESFGNPDAHSREDRTRYHNEKESSEGYRNPEFSPHEYETHRYSCQSPDLEHADAASTEPIEIKTATTTPIQDPRLTDSKYILKQEHGKETISTTVGRDIDLIPIDKVKWNMTPVEVPYALMQQPSEYRDDIVKQIYMDIDSPNADAHSAAESVPYSSNDSCNENFQGSIDVAVRLEETDFNSRQGTDAHLKDSQHINKYRIPKVGQDKINARSQMDFHHIELGFTEPHIANIHNKVETETRGRKELVHSQEPRDWRDDRRHMNEDCGTIEDKVGIQKRKANLAIVADDLELSDDNSDHFDINRHTVSENNPKKSTAQLTAMDVTCEVSVQRIDKDSSKTSSDIDPFELHSVGEFRNEEASSPGRHKTKLNPKEVRCEDSVHKIEKDPSNPYNAVKVIKNKDADSTRKSKSKLNTKEVKRDDSVHKVDKDSSKQFVADEELRNIEDDCTRKPKSKHNTKEVKCDESVLKVDKDISKTSLSFDFVDNVKIKDADCARKHRIKLNTKEARGDDSIHKAAKDSSQTSSSLETVESNVIREVKNKDTDSGRKHRGKLNTKEVRADDSVRKTAKDSSQTSPSLETIELNDAAIEKNKDVDSARKHRSELNTKEVRVNDSDHKTAKDSSQTSPSLETVEFNDSEEVKYKHADSARKHKSKLNTKEARGEDSVRKTAKGSSKRSPSFDLTDAEKAKSKEADCTKKQKGKRKKSQSVEIPKDLIESIDVIQFSEKKVKNKKEKEGKPRETKETFSALFGDSSSLMTPEDLGIPMYVPISEDAQDAVDIKIDRIIDATPQEDKDFPAIVHKVNAIEMTEEATAVTHDDKPTDVPENSNMKEKEGFEQIGGKKAPKKKGVNESLLVSINIEPHELPSPVLYENMNPGTDSNEPPDIVKTVVISTGKQPEIEFDNRELTVTPITDVVGNEEQTAADISQVPALKEFKRLDSLKALATSTPHKDFPISNPIEAGVMKSIIVCDSNKPVEQGVKENCANTFESQDAPDVRIFVKRRRKLAKRPAT